MDLFEQEIRKIAMLRPNTLLEDAILEAEYAVDDAKNRGTYVPMLSNSSPTEDVALAIYRSPELMKYVLEAQILSSPKIHMIKDTRAKFNIGLKEAKDAVELVEQWKRDGYDPTPLTREEEVKAMESIVRAMKEAPDAT